MKIVICERVGIECEKRRRPFRVFVRATERDVKPPPQPESEYLLFDSRFYFGRCLLFVTCARCCRHRVRHCQQRRISENKLKCEKGVHFSDGLEIYSSRRVMREAEACVWISDALFFFFHLCTLDTPANTNDRGWCAWLSSVQCIPLFPRNSRTRREYIEMSVKI